MAFAAPNLVLDSALSAHVLNITFTGASNGWPTTIAELGELTPVVTSSVCESLPSTVRACLAFLMPVSTSVVGLQLSVQTATAEDSYVVYTSLLSWSRNVNLPLEALQASCAQALNNMALDRLTYQTGQYRMPCRNSGVYSFLPVCQAGEVPNTVAYIANATGSTSLSSYFEGKICAGVADCSSVSIVVTPPASVFEYTIVNITNAGSALEAVLSYVADVRAAYRQSLANSGVIVTTEPGDPAAGVSATAVQMREDGMTATLFSTTENARFNEEYPVTPSCDTNTGLWALVLLVLVPLLMLTYLWVHYRGRKRSKKRQRKLIIEDEMRIMQGYTNPGGDAEMAGAADTMAAGGDAEHLQSGNYNVVYDNNGQEAEGPPPGMDYQRMLSSDAQAQDNDGGGGTVWMMDADGNYYELPAGQYHNQAAAAAAAADNGASDQAQGYPGNAEGQQPVGGDNAKGHQVHSDPNAGEAYQYAYEQTPGDDGQEVVAVDQEANQYETYVDPNTGEEYQYDPNAVQEEADGTGGLQTYVDPNTGEVYQYDPNAATEEM